MLNHHERAEHIKNNASKKLRMNLRILAIVYLILFAVTVYSIINAHAIIWQVVLGLAIGIAAGLVSSRMYKISWDNDEAKVIGRIDIYGVIVLVLFITFELNRNNIANLFASKGSLGAIGLTMITGALFGRIIGTSGRIIHIVRSQQ